MRFLYYVGYVYVLYILVKTDHTSDGREGWRRQRVQTAGSKKSASFISCLVSRKRSLQRDYPR
jgi:hypothetical protein